MRILRASDHRRMPWKNGGGETTEIAVSPDGAGLDDFEWRVSMARVDGSGPFSTFPGIDRTLAILEGAGITLDVAGMPHQTLTLASEPHAFPADTPTSADLIGGSVLDFNVMSRRGVIRHQVSRLSTPTTTTTPGQRLVLCTRGSADLVIDGQHHRLEDKDAALIDSGERAEIAPFAGGAYYLVEFRRV